MASSLQVMNKRLVLLNPKFVNQKRVGTAPVMDGRPADNAGEEGGIDMGGEDPNGENQPRVENVDQSEIMQQQEGGEIE